MRRPRVLPDSEPFPRPNPPSSFCGGVGGFCGRLPRRNYIPASLTNIMRFKRPQTTSRPIPPWRSRSSVTSRRHQERPGETTCSSYCCFGLGGVRPSLLTCTGQMPKAIKRGGSLGRIGIRGRRRMNAGGENDPVESRLRAITRCCTCVWSAWMARVGHSACPRLCIEPPTSRPCAGRCSPLPHRVV